MIKSFFKRLWHGKWRVVRTGWPYRSGWGTYRKRDRTLLDSGLSKKDAKASCDQLNKYRHY